MTIDQFIVSAWFLIGATMSVFPILLSIYLLKRLDSAAKIRREKFGKSQFKFFLVDFFSLIFLIQLPFNFLDPEFLDNRISFAIGLLVLAMVAVWWTTIVTVSQAGISTVRKRALISMIVIPSTYIGSFYLVIGGINLVIGQQFGTRAIVWFVVSAIGLVLSPFIVIQALNAATHMDELESSESLVE